MSCLVASNILDKIQITKNVEISFDCLLGNIKRCCKA